MSDINLDEDIEVYDINGMLLTKGIYDNLKLPKGLYILRQGHTTKLLK